MKETWTPTDVKVTPTLVTVTWTSSEFEEVWDGKKKAIIKVIDYVAKLAYIRRR